MDVLKLVPAKAGKDFSPAFRLQYAENPAPLISLKRQLLADLSRCDWESLRVFIQDAVPEIEPIPGADRTKKSKAFTLLYIKGDIINCPQ